MGDTRPPQTPESGVWNASELSVLTTLKIQGLFQATLLLGQVPELSQLKTVIISYTKLCKSLTTPLI